MRLPVLPSLLASGHASRHASRRPSPRPCERPILRRLLAVWLIFACSLTAPLTAHAQALFATVGAGSTAGLYYPTAEGIARIVNDADIGLRLGVRATGGAVFNAQAMQNDTMQMGMLQNNIAYFAYHGRGIVAFEGKPATRLRGIAVLYPEVVHILVRKDSGIHSPADMKGKRVAIGAIGSGPEQDSLALLAAYGLKVTDLKTAVRNSSGDAVNLLRDGKVDAMFYTTGVGAPAIVEALQTAPVTLLSMPAPKIAEMRSRYPYYTAFEIPAGTYPQVDRPTSGIAVKAMLAATESMPADKVQRLMEVLFQKRIDQFYADIPNPNLKKYFRLQEAMDDIAIPLHPGAERFYEAQGLHVNRSETPG